MDIDDVARVIRIEVEEKMLAKGFGEGEGGAADKRCLRSEPALGAAHGQRLVTEIRIKSAGKAVNNVSLRHVRKSTRGLCCCRLSGYYPLNGRA